MSDLKFFNYKSRCSIATIKQDEEIGKASKKWMVFKKKLLLKEQGTIIFKKQAILFLLLEKTAKLL